MPKNFHFRIDLKGVVMNWSASEWRRCVTDDAGKLLTPDEVKRNFIDLISQGVEFIPLGKCDNFVDGKCGGHPVETREVDSMTEAGEQFEKQLEGSRLVFGLADPFAKSWRTNRQYRSIQIESLWILWRAAFEAGRGQALEAAAKLADKMQFAAGDVLAKGHDDDAAAQHDTAMEIAEAIRELTRPAPPDSGDKKVG